ncbi:unnamed protein product [Linum trigynum]|uniref:Uncharacterized protein n=1 Tax=Linum trigynum TaxID=586398 RepID=A0AAV2F6D0_9ROSI
MLDQARCSSKAVSRAPVGRASSRVKRFKQIWVRKEGPQPNPLLYSLSSPSTPSEPALLPLTPLRGPFTKPFPFFQPSTSIPSLISWFKPSLPNPPHLTLSIFNFISILRISTSSSKPDQPLPFTTRALSNSALSHIHPEPRIIDLDDPQSPPDSPPTSSPSLCPGPSSPPFTIPNQSISFVPETPQSPAQSLSTPPFTDGNLPSPSCCLVSNTPFWDQEAHPFDLDTLSSTSLNLAKLFSLDLDEGKSHMVKLVVDKAKETHQRKTRSSRSKLEMERHRLGPAIPGILEPRRNKRRRGLPNDIEE